MCIRHVDVKQQNRGNNYENYFIRQIVPGSARLIRRSIPTKFKVELEAWIITLGAGYEVLKTDTLNVDLLAGARYFWLDIPIEFDLGNTKLLRLVREKKVDIPLMDGISKMTYLIAQYLQDNGVEQMAHKGRIQVGADADITVFDPNTVKDNSTMKDGGLPSTAMPYVVVNGIIVVKDSKVLKGVYPGKPIRRQVN